MQHAGDPDLGPGFFSLRQWVEKAVGLGIIAVVVRGDAASQVHLVLLGCHGLGLRDPGVGLGLQTLFFPGQVDSAIKLLP